MLSICSNVIGDGVIKRGCCAISVVQLFSPKEGGIIKYEEMSGRSCPRQESGN
jgi:hypothetical protein